MFDFVCVVAIGIGLAMALMARNIAYNGINSDSEQQVRAASSVGKWKWPSDMHKYANGKTHMRDVGVLMLVIMQKLLRDDKTLYPVAMVTNLANSISSILIFLVAQSYWNTEVGLLLFTLYLTCLWPFMLILYAGYQIVAQMCLLIAIYCLQQTESTMFFYTGWYFASGVAFALMLFSSGSGRKYIPLYLGAFVFSQGSSIEFLWFVTFEENISWLVVVHIFIITLLLLGLVSLLNYKSIVKALYLERLPTRWCKVLKNKNGQSLEHYFAKLKAYVRDLVYITLFIIISLSLYLIFFQSDTSYLGLDCAFLGFITTIIFLNYPDFYKTFLGYYIFWTMERWGVHHHMHEKYYLQKVGHIMDNSEGGSFWDIRFFGRMAPFHMGYYMISLVGIVYFTIDQLHLKETLTITSIGFLSISGIIWGRWTNGPQVAQAYFPSFLGMLIPIGHASFIAEKFMNSSTFWLSVGGIVFVGAMWNLKEFLRDVWPSKMGITQLKNKLDKLGISKFYTYNTPFNTALVDVLKHYNPGKYDIQYIERLENVATGHIVVPPTGAMSVNFESVKAALEENFNKDPLLEKLIDLKKIPKCSIASFKTFGASKYWTHLSDDMSYRDLLFGDITNYDRWRGLAWLIDTKKLKNLIESEKMGGF